VTNLFQESPESAHKALAHQELRPGIALAPLLATIAIEAALPGRHRVKGWHRRTDESPPARKENMMNRWLWVAVSGVLVAALWAPVAGAQDVQQDQRDLRRDNRDIRQDRRNVYRQAKDLQQDRRDVRNDPRNLTADRATLRQAEKAGRPGK